MDEVSSVHGFDGIDDYVEVPPSPLCPGCRKPMEFIKSEGFYVCGGCDLRDSEWVYIERRLWF
jgi:hypothetical protein